MRLKGFVLGTGRSGTLWLAVTLSEAGGLDARHESASRWRDLDFRKMGEVEVNSYLWECCPNIRSLFGTTMPVAHLVRDGRAVVRSMLSRPREGRTLETACEEWDAKNREVAKGVSEKFRFRLEDLVSEKDEFGRLVSMFGGKPDFLTWEWLREERVNAGGDRIFPPFHVWAEKDQKVFWSVCGDLMKEYGYS